MSDNRGWVVLSGSSTGIGRSALVGLARAGYGVLAGYRKEADGESIRAQAESLGLGGLIEPIRLDVTSAQDVARVRERVAELTRRGQRVWALVNNAGFFLVGPVETLAIEQWRAQFETNFFGALALTQALLPALIESRGRVVNVSSIGGKVAQPLVGAYTASKFAMEAMSDALRIELRGTGVHVVVVEPGAIETPIWDKGLGGEEAAVQALPAYARSRYEPMIRGLAAAGWKMRKSALPADRVGRVIVDAVRSTRPPTRRLVGKDAKILAALKWTLPTRWMDALLAKSLGIDAPAR